MTSAKILLEHLLTKSRFNRRFENLPELLDFWRIVKAIEDIDVGSFDRSNLLLLDVTYR